MKTALCLTMLSLFVLRGDPTPVDFATLSDFEYKEGAGLPASVTKYDKQSIRISGFMKAEDGSSEGEAQYFILVNDACGCQGVPKLNEMIFCTMPEGRKAGLKPNVATVTGKLYVGEVKEDGVVVSLYTMEVSTVE